MKKLLMACYTAMAACCAWADTETVGGYTWTYQVNGDSVEICNGDEVAISPMPAGSVKIPITLGGKFVTSIGSSAFWACSNMTSIIIPSNVMKIQPWAFAGCGSLVSVIIRDGVTSIGDHAFDNCWSLTSVTIPASVTSIGADVFSGCSGLTSVTISDGVTSIGRYAFAGCSGLTSVTIPSSVTSIGSYGFHNCKSLPSVTIPASVTRIGSEAFGGCGGLMNIYFDGNAPDMGIDVFKGVAQGCTAYVNWYSTGWGVSIPGTWNEINIRSRDSSAGGASVVPSSGGTVPDMSFSRAQSVNGALYGMDNRIIGVMQVTVGRIDRKGDVKVSATATLLNGKKVSAKAVTLTRMMDGALSGTLVFKTPPLGSMAFAMAADGVFTLQGGGCTMGSAVVGGVAVSGGKFTLDKDFTLAQPWELQTKFLPYEVPYTVVGGKWKFAKAAAVKYDSKKGEVVADMGEDGEKSNLSGLNVSYAAKTGLLRGTFKAYVLERNLSKKVLRKYIVKVSGVVVDGVGYGQATCKSPASGPWTVMLR